MSHPATPSAAYRMISIPQAQETVLGHCRPLPAEPCSLASAVGAILAEDVLALEPVPPFPASIKDGYAVRSGEGAGEFPVAFEVHAGSNPGPLPEGHVAYIATGAALPPGADAVVQIENTTRLPAGAEGSPSRVRLNKAAKGPGDDVRQVGSDIKEGELVLARGSRLAPAEIGILATVGAAELQVHRRPRVGVLSTGDELAPPGARQLAPGGIRDANRPMLLAALAQGGFAGVDLGIARDTAKAVEESYNRALEERVDVLVLSGGVSMGDKDFVKPLLERHGTVHFGKVKMKPGKPLTFATVPRAGGPGAGPALLVFGLPGNPVSSIVTYSLVVLPALRALAGWREPGLRRVQARTSTPLKLDPERPEYHRATLHWQVDGGDPPGGHWVAESTGGQISSRLLSMRSANALLELPAAAGVVPAGTTVSALLIADLADMPHAQGQFPDVALPRAA